MPHEQHKIRLSEASPRNPPDLLDRLKEAIDELFDCSVSATGGYVKGKSDQELAKATEIKAKAFAQLANLDLERQRLGYCQIWCMGKIRQPSDECYLF